MLVLGKVAPSLSTDGALTSTELIRRIRDGEKGGMGWGKREITYLITIGMSSPSVTTRMTPALRWAARGAILMFH